MDFDLLIQRKRERFEQLECEIADPSLFENRNRAGEIMREHANVKALLAKWNELSSARMQLADNRELANSTDVDLAQMAQEEIPALEKRVADLEREMQVALLPPDENENRDAIIEIRAGTGGSEAAIFAADLYRMYNRFAESAGLKIESMDSSPSELGGLKEVIFKVSGESVFRKSQSCRRNHAGTRERKGVAGEMERVVERANATGRQSRTRQFDRRRPGPNGGGRNSRARKTGGRPRT